MNTDITDPTYKRGLDKLKQVEGVAHPSIVESMKDIAPDLADLAIRFVYGDVYDRSGLTLRERQLITVAALAALGNARPQLKFHLLGALNVGCTASELVALMIHLVVYAGFPSGLNGVFALKEAFAEKGVIFTPQSTHVLRSRYEAGLAALQQIDGQAGEKVIESLRDISPDLGRLIIEFAFGDVYTRTDMCLLDRELVTIAALAAMGTATPQLKVHIHGLFNVGGSMTQLTETIIHIAAYAGFPAAINAMLAAKEVAAERVHAGQ
ncbi:MAG: carboxymuconolactone decarboxylase family protein [Burkholderiales bacterium]|nr:carboxymuconolactone decarboxylase family protein [Burkholderiales bacterium]